MTNFLSLSIAFLLLLSPLLCEENVSLKDNEKFFELQKLYYHWSENFYNADAHYRVEIAKQLYAWKGSVFVTPQMSCTIERDLYDNRQLVSVFYLESWLEIVVRQNEKELVSFLKAHKKRGSSFHSTLILSGTLSRFHVDKISGRRAVRLYLQNVNINYLKPAVSSIK